MIDPTRTNFNTDLDSDANIENKGTSLHVNNSVISSILNDSERKDVEIIDETTLETSVMNPGHAHKKDLPEVDESLNDSDFIPATQDFGANNAKTVSQNSKLDYSEESFKLGLTQLMEEESEVRTSQEKTESNKKSEIDKTSQNSVGTKKFVFKKLNVITPIAVVPEVQDDGIYDVQTQKLCEDDKFDTSNDDHVFLQPTQTFTAKKKKSKDLAASEEDIYALSTQKYYESPEKSCVEDIYLQSTQKMSAPDLDVGKNTDLQSKEDFYQQSTQKLTEIEKPVTLNDDLEDMFASQAMSPKTTPSKCLESELECMFATQSAVPTEDSLDKIKDIILSKEIVDTKLPEEDSDLEAILATQRLLDSPKSSKVPEKPANKEAVLGRSIESQLEVIFASQVNNLPSDKFPRPANPLVNLFSEETQETDDFISNAEKKSDEHSISDMQNKSEVSECSSISRSCQNGLEQSFALLEAKSTRIRRSARSTNCEELVVTCPKSRKSMVIAPNEKEDENSVPVKTKRKRQPSISSEISKPETKESKRRSAKQTKKITDSLNVSDDDSRQSVGSNRSTRSNKTKDQNDDADSFASNSKLKNKSESNRNSDKDKGRSKSSNRSKKIDNNSDSSGDFETRKTKLKDDVKLAEVDDVDVSKINSSSRSGRMSRVTKRLDKIQEIEDIEEGKVSLENLANKQKSEIKTNNKRKKLNVEDNEINEDKSIETTNNQEGSKEVASTRMNARTKTRIDIQEDTPKKKLPRSRKELNENCNSSNKNKDGRNSRNASRSSSSSSANENQKSTSLSGIKRGGTIEVTTPSKTRRLTEITTPSNSLRKVQTLDTPSRNKRKQKPKVVFTMMDDPQLESVIRQLGGSVVDSVDICNVLITQSVKRTLKLLTAVGQGKPICSTKWVETSKKENQFVDAWDYILIDKEAERKWNFSLRTSLERSLQEKLFEGYTFQLLVTTALDVLKGAIESCGGKTVTKTLKGVNKFVVVSSPDNKEKYKKLLKQQPNLMIVEPEAIFDGVLRQEIRFEKHLLK